PPSPISKVLSHFRRDQKNLRVISDVERVLDQQPELRRRLERRDPLRLNVQIHAFDQRRDQSPPLLRISPLPERRHVREVSRRFLVRGAVGYRGALNSL